MGSGLVPENARSFVVGAQKVSKSLEGYKKESAATLTRALSSASLPPTKSSPSLRYEKRAVGDLLL